MSGAHSAQLGEAGGLLTLLASLQTPDAAFTVLDHLSDTVFFIKDAAGRYLSVNRTLTERLGLDGPAALLGRTALEVFPEPLGARYAEQDRLVLAGRQVRDQLERHPYPGGRTGWCLTTKLPLLDSGGRIVGLSGFSRDLPLNHDALAPIAEAADYVRDYHATPQLQPLRASALAERAGLSQRRFEHQVRQVFGITPAQLIARARLEAATRLLETTALSVAQVAAECGYADHSAFSRQFRSATGVTPSQHRQMWPRPTARR